MRLYQLVSKLELKPENYNIIVEKGKKNKNEINRSVKISHPEKSYLSSVTHIQFVDDFDSANLKSRNAVVFPPGAIDRSPCGTGTSARLALLNYRNQLKKASHLLITA